MVICSTLVTFDYLKIRGQIFSADLLFSCSEGASSVGMLVSMMPVILNPKKNIDVFLKVQTSSFLSS